MNPDAIVVFSVSEHSAKSESSKETIWAGTWSWAEEIGGVDEGGWGCGYGRDRR